MAWSDTLTEAMRQAQKGGPQAPKFVHVGGLDFRLRRLEMGAPRLRAGQQQPTTGFYSRVPRDMILDGKSLNITTSSVQKKGGVSISANTSGFAYTSTATSITWYWDGTNSSTVITLHRADNTSEVLPTLGSGLTITGLANTTKYYFLPFWTPEQSCTIGWVKGTTGSPQIAFVAADTTANNGSQYLLQQTLQNREPLTSGFMTATTGSSGGGGGGGGGGTCVMSGTDIVPCGGGDYEIRVHSEREWMRIEACDGRHLFCTLNHPLYREDAGRVRADSLERGMALLMDDGVREVKSIDLVRKSCSKWSVHMPDGHLYFANGFISHNAKPFIP